MLKMSMPFVGTLIVCIGLFCIGGAGIVPSGPGFDAGRFAALGRDDLKKELEKQVAERMEFQRQVTVELRTGQAKSSSLLAAIFLAGLHRMETTCPDLARLIAVRDDSAVMTKALSFWAEHPAAEALARIGNPAVPSLIRNLATSQDAEVRRLSGQVLRIILTPGPAKRALEDAAEAAGKSGDPTGAAQLLLAMPLVEMPKAEQ